MNFFSVKMYCSVESRQGTVFTIIHTGGYLFHIVAFKKLQSVYLRFHLIQATLLQPFVCMPCRIGYNYVRPGSFYTRPSFKMQRRPWYT